MVDVHFMIKMCCVDFEMTKLLKALEKYLFGFTFLVFSSSNQYHKEVWSIY